MDKMFELATGISNRKYLLTLICESCIPIIHLCGEIARKRGWASELFKNFLCHLLHC